MGNICVVLFVSSVFARLSTPRQLQFTLEKCFDWFEGEGRALPFGENRAGKESGAQDKGDFPTCLARLLSRIQIKQRSIPSEKNP